MIELICIYLKKSLSKESVIKVKIKNNVIVGQMLAKKLRLIYLIGNPHLAGQE